MFEKGVGVVLRNAWNHIEVLQTTDLPALIHSLGDVWAFALDNPEFQEQFISDMHQRQEVMAYYYMWGLCKNAEEIGEGRIMSFFRSRGVFMLGVRWMAANHRSLLSTHVLKGCEALALVAATEDFSTYKDEYVVNRVDSEGLQILKTECLTNFQSDIDVRRKIRPLMDAADQARRKFGTK